MKAELINPFLSSTLNVLTTMCKVKPIAGTPRLKQGSSTWGAVTGIIGMASDKLSGNMVISFDEPSILALVSNMLSEKFVELNPEIVDAVGELTNMISGGAKNQLSELGYNFSMATPIMITGQGVSITQLSKAPVIQIPFEMPEGKFVIEANLAESKKS